MKTPKSLPRVFSKGLMTLVCAALLFVSTNAFAWSGPTFDADSGTHVIFDGGTPIDRWFASEVTFNIMQTWASGWAHTGGYDGTAFDLNLSVNTNGVAPGFYLVAVLYYTDAGGGPVTINYYVLILE
jgi:hypothetical protein